MIKTKYKFKGAVLCRGQMMPFETEVTVEKDSQIANEIRESFKKELNKSKRIKLNKNERLTIIKRSLTEVERTI